MTRFAFILIFLSSIISLSATGSPALADENPNAEENLALFEEALKLQGYLAPQLNLQDFNGGSEAFYERQGVNPEFISGDWVLFSPTGQAYFWESYGKFTALNNFRVKAGTSALPARNAQVEIWKLRHTGVADAHAGGFSLHETDRLRFGIEFEELFGSGLSASYRRNDVNRNNPHPALPGYYTDNFLFEYLGPDVGGVEWNAGFSYSELTSKDLGFSDSAEKSLWIAANRNFFGNVRINALIGKDWLDTAGDVTGTDFGFSRDRFKLGARYGEADCPWFAGADYDLYATGRTPIYGSHLTRGDKLNMFAGYRGFYFADKIRLGFERSNMNSFRLLYERPEFDRLLIGRPAVSADDLGIIQIERPTYDKWYADGLFTIGPAKLSASYSTSEVEKTATWRPSADAYPVRSYWPDGVDTFSAFMSLPITGLVSLNLYDNYRKTSSSARKTSQTESMFGGDVSFGFTENHSFTFGYETADLKTGAPTGSTIGGKINQDTWRVGLTGDYDAWDFALSFYSADAGSPSYNAASWGSWNAFEGEVTMRKFGFPLTLGCEIFEAGYDFSPALDSDGFKLWAKVLLEF